MAQIKISELSELETKQSNDIIPIVDVSEGETKKIKVDNLVSKNKPLIAVTDEEPTEFSEGDEYYNTDERLIYTALNSTTWSVEGKVPEEGIMYVVFPEKSTFAWDGSDLISVGGGSGSSDIVVVPTETPTEETKLEIEDEDFDFKGSEITDEYSESTEVGYSANYSNGHFQTKGIILYNNATGTNGDVTLSNNVSNYDYLEIYGYENVFNSNVYTKYDVNGGKNLLLSCVSTNNEQARLQSHLYTINNNIIASSKTQRATILDRTIAEQETNNEIYITKVIGYKEV